MISPAQICIHQGNIEVGATVPPVVSPEQTVIYEVVRVMQGRVLFLEDHLDRLYASAVLAGQPLTVSGPDLARQLRDLIRASQCWEGNIRIEFRFSTHSDYYAFFVPHHYPSPAEYLHGVKVGLLVAERIRPNAKIVQAGLRERADQLIASEGLYEVLLVHPSGYITEGSRSNFFVIRDGCAITAPLSSVLGGITRMQVIRVCTLWEIPVREQLITPEELDACEAAFLTGTSPKVLPVAQAGRYHFDVRHPVLRRIMEGYDRHLQEYLDQNM